MAKQLVGEDMDAYAARRRSEIGQERSYQRPGFFKRPMVGSGSGLGFNESFLLPFTDRGNGSVETTPQVGDVSATFTRATTATTIGPTGLVVSVASGTARSYYDPTSLAYLGYLAEGSRINLALQSEAFNTTWTVSNAADEQVTANAIASPDGAVTADKIEEKATTAAHFVTQDVVLTASTVYSISCFAKQAERKWMQLFALCTDGNNRGCNFDLNAGTVGTVWGGGTVSGSIKAYPNGWYRCTIVLDTGAGATATKVRVGSATSDSVGIESYAGTLSSGLYAWGYQAEAGAFASSYIPTTVATVTRNTDILTYPVAPWFGNGTNNGTFFVQCQLSSIDTATQFNAAGLGTGGNNRFDLRAKSAATAASLFAYGTGAGVVSLTGGNPAANTAFKIACSFGSSGGAIATNGTLGTTSGTASDFGAQVTIGIGMQDTGGSNPLFGPISRIAYFNSRLPDGSLRAITA